MGSEGEGASSRLSLKEQTKTKFKDKKKRHEETSKLASAVEAKELETAADGGVAEFPEWSEKDGEKFMMLTEYQRLSIGRYKGVARVDLRNMYRDKATQEMKPTQKGISLTLASFRSLLRIDWDAALADFE